jgi:SAM-dependent methyltransferase
MSDDPREAARRKFDSPAAVDPGAPLDVIARCATDPPLAIATLIEALRPAAGHPGARVCELGFGSGWLLDELLSAFPSARIHGLDMSRQFTADARDRCGGAVSVVRGDMEALPFRDGALDAVVTCWTLYFMRDIDAALEGMRRCLRSGGIFVAATVAPDHMLEFYVLADEAERIAGIEHVPDIGERFDTESGMAPMRRAFGQASGDVELREWRGELVLPDVETAMVLWPGYGPQLSGDDAVRATAAFEALVREKIARDGPWRIRRHDGAFVARA